MTTASQGILCCEDRHLRREPAVSAMLRRSSEEIQFASFGPKLWLVALRWPTHSVRDRHLDISNLERHVSAIDLS